SLPSISFPATTERCRFKSSAVIVFAKDEGAVFFWAATNKEDKNNEAKNSFFMCSPLTNKIPNLELNWCVKKPKNDKRREIDYELQVGVNWCDSFECISLNTGDFFNSQLMSTTLKFCVHK